MRKAMAAAACVAIIALAGIFVTGCDTGDDSNDGNAALLMLLGGRQSITVTIPPGL